MSRRRSTNKIKSGKSTSSTTVETNVKTWSIRFQVCFFDVGRSFSLFRNFSCQEIAVSTIFNHITEVVARITAEIFI